MGRTIRSLLRHGTVAFLAWIIPGATTPPFTLAQPYSSSRQQPGSVDTTNIPFSLVTVDNFNPHNPHCKTIGDIDGDGLLDVLAASSSNYTDGLFWYKYPSWTKYKITGGSFSTNMQTTDVDGDGDLDVVIPKGTDIGSSVYWYENPRPGGDPGTTPWREHFVGFAGAHDVEVGDINRDGRIDIVVRYNYTTIFFQNPDSSWTPVTVSGAPSEGLALGDIDGDGDLDLLLNGFWLENPLPGGNPVTTPWPSHQFATGWPGLVSARIADINKDGRMDLIMAPSESPNGKLSWFESTTPLTGPWTEHVIASDVSYMHMFRVVDMNNDGNLDIAAAEMHQSDQKRVSVYINTGNALSWKQQVLATTGSHNICVGDFGNDGDMDIVGANWNDSNPNRAPIQMWESRLNNPPLTLDSWERHEVDPSRPWQSIFITAADIDRDGKKDIVTGAWWYRNPGTPGGTWVRNTIGAPLNNMAAVADFDNDGAMDILGTQGVGSNTNNDFAWARNNGNGTLTVQTNVQSGGVGTFLQGVATARFQTTGPIEVALSWNHAPVGTQMLSVPADPSGSTWPIRLISAVSQGQGLDAKDIDRDGDPDLSMGTRWLRNDGLNSWTPFTLADSVEMPDRNKLVDINGDGRLDLVVGYEVISAPGKFAWYEQPANPTAAWTEHIISNTVVGPMSLDVADIDRDGDLDIVVGEHNLANPASARLLIFENLDGHGGSWAQHLVYQGDEHHDGAQLVDIDNDGDLDIISIGWQNYKTILYENKAINSTQGQNAPVIISQPVNRTITIGQTATFTVVASGAAPLLYQWEKNTIDITGATAPSYTTPAATSSDSGAIFRCTVSNPYGTTKSNVAVLTVIAAGNSPVITAQPVNQAVAAGQTATFAVTATGASPLFYQWQNDSIDIAGAVAQSYTTPATTPADSGATFRCRISNSYGTISSNAAFLLVGVAPAITTHPADQIVTMGQTATFTVVASGSTPLSYQWQKNAVDISGATGQQYITPATSSSDSGASFRCRVSNLFGTVTSNAASLIVNPPPPVITQQPSNQAVTAGSTATFTTAASSSVPLTYQWQRNAANIPGATNSSYTTPATTATDNGAAYRCVISNSGGSVTSGNAILSVLPLEPSRVTANLQVLYGFEDGSGATIHDVSGVGTAVNLTIENTAGVSWGQGFLTVTATTTIASGAVASKIVDACKATNEMTIEAWVKPASTTQNGPARIVTLSADVLNRDFTLGQGVAGGSSNVWDVRRRTTTTNSNGMPSLSTSPGTLTTQLTHVVATRSSAGVNKIYLNGIENSSGTVSGDFSTWTNYQFALANELSNDRPWLGEYHLVAVYNRALTPAEIAQNYAVGPGLNPAIYANLMIMLEGPYDAVGDSLRTDLRSKLPLAQPYNASPWNYSGTESVISMPPGVVDWVLVELRTGTGANTKVATRAGFVKQNGIVVDLDGTSSLAFEEIEFGNYYIVVRHRNHLAIMSASPVTLSQTSSLFDFTTSQSQAYGTNPMKLTGTRYCMYAGDANASGVVTTSDAGGVFNALLTSGYDTNDINLSGVVSTADANIILANLLAGSQVTGPVEYPGEIVPAVLKTATAPRKEK